MHPADRSLDRFHPHNDPAERAGAARYVAYAVSAIRTGRHPGRPGPAPRRAGAARGRGRGRAAVTTGGGARRRNVRTRPPETRSDRMFRIQALALKGCIGPAMPYGLCGTSITMKDHRFIRSRNSS